MSDEIKLDEKDIEKNKLELRNRIIDQQFWFTATTMGVNGFLISNYDKIIYSHFSLWWISFINFYAIFLIIHRAASHAFKTTLPQKLSRKPQSEKGFFDKFKETLFYFKVAFEHIPFIIGEFSGSLFYILLVLTSYGAFVSICKFN